jgi:hypothetical protein
MEIIFVELKLICGAKKYGDTNGGLVQYYLKNRPLSGKIIHVLVQGGFLIPLGLLVSKKWK